jgi:hypothetical protein
MMKMGTKKAGLLMGIALLASSLNALASGSTGYVKVDVIASRSTGDLMLHTSQNINPDGCPRRRWLALPVDHPGFNLIASQLLTAKTLDMDVNVSVMDCYGEFPEIRAVKLR